MVTLAGALAAPPEELEQLFRGMKAELLAGVDFLNPTVEPAVRIAVRPELQNEGPSHHDVRLRRLARRARENPVEISVESPLKRRDKVVTSGTMLVNPFRPQSSTTLLGWSHPLESTSAGWALGCLDK